MNPLKNASIIAMSICVFVITGCKEVSTSSTDGPQPPGEPPARPGSVAHEIDLKHGRRLIANAKYEEAVVWAMKVREHEPTNLDAGLILVLGNIFQKKATEAKEVSTRLIEKHRTEARVITVHALALAANDQVTDAIAQLEKGVEQAPGNVHMHSALAALYTSQMKPLMAEKHFVVVRSLDPTYDGIPVSGGFQEFTGWVERHQGAIGLALALIGGLVKFIAALA